MRFTRQETTQGLSTVLVSCTLVSPRTRIQAEAFSWFCYFLAGVAIEKLRDAGMEITEEDQLCVQIAVYLIYLGIKVKTDASFFLSILLAVDPIPICGRDSPEWM